ncbi:class I SAM-dependent methyltransferase [Bacteriovoracaceae bacterium]|nr:class I SAM-dependent methyltransferase [Bacteriovoracaceae bacterium]
MKISFLGRDDYNSGYHHASNDIWAEIDRSANRLPYANESYVRFISESLAKYVVTLNPTILQIGSGLGDNAFLLSEKNRNISILGIDFSEYGVGIAKIRQDCQERFNGHFQVEDFLQFQSIEKYDVIVDNYLLHNIVNDDDRKLYYNRVLKGLKAGGIFIAETMVFEKHVEVEDPYWLDSNFVLWKRDNSSSSLLRPIRKVMKSFDLEQELDNANIGIEYFCYCPHLKYQMGSRFELSNKESDLEYSMMRLVCRKDKGEN